MDLSTLKGGVAVVTGSASGLGYALAARAAQSGMNIMLSDVRQGALDEAVAKLREDAPIGTVVVGCLCDVTSKASVQGLLLAAQDVFRGSPIQFVGANAGVLFPGSTVLSGTADEWQFTYAVNVQVFVPELLKQGQWSGDATTAQIHSIVEITASVAGVRFGPYGSSKQAAVGIAESLHGELKLTPGGDAVHVSVLCPGVVQTGLLTTSSELTKKRNDLSAPIDGMKGDGTKSSENSVNTFGALWSKGLTADYCAAELFDHASQDKFYCLLDNEFDGVAAGMTD
eukprot:gene11571-30232_t